MMTKERPYLIAIAGGSGSGKTWLADRLDAKLRGVARLSLDDFYRDQSHLSPARRACLNYDNPRMIEWNVLEKALNRFKMGRSVSVPRYDFATHSRGRKTKLLAPAKFLIVDGLWLLRRPAVRRSFDLRIFIECPDGLRLQRRLARDIVERGRTEISVREQFAATVKPMHEKFVSPQSRWAHIVLQPDFGGREVKAIVELCLQRRSRR
jgi:uridine kinase